MKSIAFFNNKGGVSKTTTALNVAYILGQVYKRKVLVVDCDGQQNASRFLADNISEIGLESVLTDYAISPESALSETRYDNINVLTSTPEMNRCTEKFQQLDDTEIINNLTKIIRFWEEKYDYVLLDTPPINVVTDSQLMNSIIGGHVFVVRENATSHPDIAEALEKVSLANGRKLGFIKSFCTGGMKSSYGKKKYGRYGKKYGYYQSYEQAEPAPNRK